MSCPPAKSCSKGRRRSCCAARISSGRTWAGEEAAMTAGTGATVRTVLDTGRGLVRRQVEVPAGARHAGAAGPGGELCFVIEGAGQLSSGTDPGRPVQPGTGVWLPPRTSYSLAAAAPGPLRLDSVLLPAPAPGAGTASPGTASPGTASPAGPLLADLAEQPPEITGDRQFRVLLAPGQGCAAATQFVGEIPPGRAP